LTRFNETGTGKGRRPESGAAASFCSIKNILSQKGRPAYCCKTVEEYLLSPNIKILSECLAKHPLTLVIRIEGNRKNGLNIKNASQIEIYFDTTPNRPMYLDNRMIGQRGYMSASQAPQTARRWDAMGRNGFGQNGDFLRLLLKYEIIMV
jgi:hypothetical protein